MIYLAGTDFSHLTNDELIKGIKALDLPDYIRSKAYGIDVRETLAQMTEMTIQLGVNMGLSPEDALSWGRKLQETVSQSEFDSWVATLLDGGPSIFMNTLSELQSTYPNGAPGVALVRETDPAKIYVWNGSSWESFGNYQGIEIKDNTVSISKLTNDAVSFLKDINYQQSFLKFNETFNLTSGFNDGSLNLITSTNTNTSGSYIDNVSPFDVQKNYRFNYGIGSELQTSDYFSNLSNPRFGMWLRISDINAMGTKTMRFGFRSTGSPATYYFGQLINSENLKTPGHTSVRVNNGVSTTTDIITTYEGWVYVEVSVSGQITGNYRPIIGTGTESVVGKIDIANLTLVDSVNRILPFSLYYGSSDQIPLSNFELNSKLDTLEGQLGSIDATLPFRTAKGNIIGDSIAFPSEGYARVIENNLGMENRFNRHALGGKPMANGTSAGDGGNTFAKVWTDGNTIDYTPYSLSLIMMGTNDFKLDVPIGSIAAANSGNYDTNTFLGAYQDLVEYILQKNPSINILLFTPLQRDKDGYNTTSTNAAGHKLIDYVSAIKQIGELYALPVYDAYHNSGVNLLTLDTYTYDGLHLNGQSEALAGNGYKMVGTKMAKFIKNNAVIV